METVANNIAFSVNVATAPNSTPEERGAATKFCNDYINNTPPPELCEVGFLLTTHQDPGVIRTGLQFIEHVAKFGWQLVPSRELAKEKLFMLMHSGSENWPSFLQEALARVIVEIAKREWPQLWPNLFPQLFEIANSSDLALLVLRRMVEDVATLQTVDCHERRRELSMSLALIAPDVINTFFAVLVESVKQYQLTSHQIYQKRAKVCLGCLLPYIEWTNPAIFLKNNMVTTLFALLPDFYFQMNASECILQLVERKPTRKEDRYEIPNLCLLDESFYHFLQAAVSAQPNNCDFLSKLGDILTALASNTTVGKVKLENFIKGCETLAAREEAVSVLGSVLAVNTFLKTLDKDSSTQPQSISPGIVEEIDKSLIKLLTLILQKFVAAAPKSSERQEMHRLKSEFSTLLRTVGRRVPTLYNEVNGWLRNSLNSADTIKNFQWEALTLVVDAVSSSVSEGDAETIKVGLMDLQITHTKFNLEQSLELKSLILSLVSALFVFLSLAKQRREFGEAHNRLMISIFESLFKVFYYDDTTNTREIRRHSSALFIKLAIKYPEVMALGFDYLQSSASAVAPKLSTMEYCNILESLMQISNVWNDFGKQTTFLGSLFNQAEWQQVSAIVDTPQSFVAVFASEESFPEVRALLMRSLGTASASLSRIKKVTKHSTSILQPTFNSRNTEIPLQLSNGACGSGDCDVHPAYDHICPLLPIILKLVKTIHSLVEIPDLGYIQELSDSERIAVIGMQSIDRSCIAEQENKTKSHKDKIKTFVLNLQELSYSILGESSRVFGPRFYSIPQLSDAYLSFVGHNIQLLNDFRLRGIIRNVFKVFLLSCPVAQAHSVIIPFSQRFLPFMFDRLANRWQVIETAKSNDSDGEEEKEVIENSALRLLTKEYIELLGRLLEKHSGDVVIPPSEVQVSEMDMDNEVGSSGTRHSQGVEIGEIGVMLLGDPICFNAIVNCIVSCICWDDSIVCCKASRLLLLIWERISSQLTVMKATFVKVLRAVCVWVENESNMDSLLRILDSCFLSYYNVDPQFIQMLKDWGAPEAEIQKLIALCHAPKNEKKRKELLRKLVNNNPALERNKSPKAQWLKGLPQLKVNTEGKEKVGAERSPEIDLTECFSLIHK